MCKGGAQLSHTDQGTQAQLPTVLKDFWQRYHLPQKCNCTWQIHMLSTLKGFELSISLFVTTWGTANGSKCCSQKKKEC